MLTERQEVIDLCLNYPGAYEDYPFQSVRLSRTYD